MRLWIGHDLREAVFLTLRILILLFALGVIVPRLVLLILQLLLPAAGGPGDSLLIHGGWQEWREGWLALLRQP